MKNFRHFLLRVPRKSPAVYRQMELSLPGSRLTREEASFLRELRRLREQLTASRT